MVISIWITSECIVNNNSAILTNSSNSGSPRQLTSGADLILSNNIYGVQVNNDGQLAITGQTSAERLLIKDSNYANSIAGLFVESGSLSIDNMNIEYVNNTHSGAMGNNVAVYNQGNMTLAGSTQGTHNLTIINNISNLSDMYGIFNEAGATDIKNMNINFSNSQGQGNTIGISNGDAGAIVGSITTIASEPAIIDSISKAAVENMIQRIDDYPRSELEAL